MYSPSANLNGRCGLKSLYNKKTSRLREAFSYSSIIPILVHQKEQKYYTIYYIFTIYV